MISKIFLVALFIVLGACASTNTQVLSETEYPNISMVRLIATPEVFDGKGVALFGYLSYEFEDQYLYLHKEDFENFSTVNAIGVATPTSEPLIEAASAAHGKYVYIIGRFSAEGGLGSGYLSDIKEIKVWPQLSRE